MENKSQLGYVIGYFAAFLIIAFLGALFQYRQLPEEEEKDDMMAGEEEGRTCGCF
jgi:hypothetical protein